MDWQPYFTTRLVDDFATHLRVFRKAQDRLAERDDKQSEFGCGREGGAVGRGRG